MNADDRKLAEYLLGRVANIPQDALDARAKQDAWEQEIRVSDEIDETGIVIEDDEEPEIRSFGGPTPEDDDYTCPDPGNCCFCGTCDCVTDDNDG